LSGFAPKRLLNSAWSFSNWLTHTKSSKWHDAEAALTTTEHAVGLCISAVLQHIRGVPDACPACGSHRLSPERAYDPENPGNEWERPVCTKCDWTGRPVQIHRVPVSPSQEYLSPPEGECIMPTVPLRSLEKPGNRHHRIIENGNVD
jgi:hypothetical protein